jgi:hypothetical protein
MRFRTSITSVHMTLLTAMGFGSVAACSSSVVGRNSSGANDAGATGGSENAGAPNGGIAGGGTTNGGGPSGGVSNGGASAGAPNGGATAGSPNSGGSGGTIGVDGSAGTAGTDCTDPVPLAPLIGSGPSGGFVKCANQMVHRPGVDDCWSSIDPLGGPGPIPYWPDGSASITCRTHGECTDAPHGYCNMTQTQPGLGGAPNTGCVYGCVRDSECGPGQICLCGNPVGTCVAATCISDADCPAGTPCMMGMVWGLCDPGTPHFQCGPLCVTNLDCPADNFGRMICRSGNCSSSASCGRPFLVAGEARLADTLLRSDWAAPLAPDVASLPPEARRTLADHYAAVGLMEHASVAAFARFSLELLALGAPAEIVRLAASALGDETEHARLCFGLASSYGGHAVGPGPLETAGALADTSFVEKVRTAFVEACVGETCAAVEAAEAAERAADPVVRAVLRRIAADETRHAELGWKFAQWAIDRMDSAVRTELIADLASAIDREVDTNCETAEASSPHAELLAAHGVLPASLRGSLRKATLRDAVLPCLRTLSTALNARAVRTRGDGVVNFST